MKRLGDDGSSGRPDDIEDAEFEEVSDESYTLGSSVPWPPPTRESSSPSSPPTLRAWWKGKGVAFKALFCIIAALFIVPVGLFLFGIVSIEKEGTAGGAQPTGESQASNRIASVAFPAGVRPEAVLAIDGGNADPTSTFRTMGAFLCPLIVNGWSIEADVAASKRHRSGATGSLVTYSVTRGDDPPMTMVAFRMDVGDGQPVEVLSRIQADGETVVGPQIMPHVLKALSYDLPQCRDNSGAVR